MKRNKKVKKHSRCTVNSVNFVALIVLSFFAVMVYWSQDARCTALSQELGKAEKEFARLERDCQREAVNWEELKTPENLQRALIRHGLDMGPANPGEQVVNMTSAGQPAPGQMSVARIKARRGLTERMVLADSPSSRMARRKKSARR
jgi:hypothetical protein